MLDKHFVDCFQISSELEVEVFFSNVENVHL